MTPTYTDVKVCAPSAMTPLLPKEDMIEKVDILVMISLNVDVIIFTSLFDMIT